MHRPGPFWGFFRNCESPRHQPHKHIQRRHLDKSPMSQRPDDATEQAAEHEATTPNRNPVPRTSQTLDQTRSPRCARDPSPVEWEEEPSHDTTIQHPRSRRKKCSYQRHREHLMMKETETRHRYLRSYLMQYWSQTNAKLLENNSYPHRVKTRGCQELQCSSASLSSPTLCRLSVSLRCLQWPRRTRRHA